MSEVVAEISAEVKQFLDGDRTDVQRTIHRTAIIDADGTDINIEQAKLLSPEEMKLVQISGALALATTEWFNAVEWLQQPHERLSWRGLQLDATYPLEYFDEPPIEGAFRGERWLDQYASIDGFGNKDRINLWLLRFVTSGGHAITKLHYPDNPTALDIYNARYRQYLDDLDAADPTISYSRGWNRVFSRDRGRTPRVLGGLSLAGLGVYEVLQQGSPAPEDEVNNTSILLHYESEQNGYVGRDITITDEGAITEPYWDGEEDREPASEELLTTTLELIRDVTTNNA